MDGSVARDASSEIHLSLPGVHNGYQHWFAGIRVKCRFEAGIVGATMTQV
jgi:hypothetical protein